MAGHVGDSSSGEFLQQAFRSDFIIMNPNDVMMKIGHREALFLDGGSKRVAHRGHQCALATIRGFAKSHRNGRAGSGGDAGSIHEEGVFVKQCVEGH